jgi:hypothetical protein
MHSTNYIDTFITIAPDSDATHGTVPKETPIPTVALRAFRMIHDHPYRYTSDDVIFTVHADRAGIPATKRDFARTEFFSKGQACLRASDLAKRYGLGNPSRQQRKGRALRGRDEGIPGIRSR